MEIQNEIKRQKICKQEEMSAEFWTGWNPEDSTYVSYVTVLDDNFELVIEHRLII
jgi:hypothetical protein